MLFREINRKQLSQPAGNGNPRPFAILNPFIVTGLVAAGMNGQPGVGDKTMLGQHRPNQQFQKSGIERRGSALVRNVINSKKAWGI